MIDFDSRRRLIWCMCAASHSFGTSIFALRLAFADGLSGEVEFTLACLALAAIVFWEPWLGWQDWWRARSTGQPRLRYEEQGRCGRIHFENGRARFDLYWEFGGGQTLAVIDAPSPEEWVSRTGLPLSERDSVLRFIATQVIRDKTSTGRNRFEIGPAGITIFEA